MKLEEAKTILEENGYRVLTESAEEAQVYLFLDKPKKENVKVWFDSSGQKASDITLNLNIDYFKELLSKLGVSNKAFKLLDILDWSCIQETYEEDSDLYAFGEAHSSFWDNGAFGGNNNPDFEWGGELTAELYFDNEDAVVHFLRNIAAEALVTLCDGYFSILDANDYIDDENLEEVFTIEEYKKFIDELGITNDEVVDFVNAMSDDNLIKTLVKNIKETPDFSERL